MANGPTLRQLRIQEGMTGEEATEFTELASRLDPADQARLTGIDVYDVPGGSVQLFRGTGDPASQVRLENLESAFFTGSGPIPARLQGDIPTDSETGQPDVAGFREAFRSGEVTDPRLAAHMEDPDLAQTEADIARVRHQDPEKLKGAELEEYNAAVERLERPPGPRPDMGQLPERITFGQIDQFMDQFIQTTFGETGDPRTRNIHEEIQVLPETFFRTFYQDRLYDPMDPESLLYDDLPAAQREKIRQMAKKEEFERLSAEKSIQAAALDRFETTLRNRAKRQAKVEADMQKLQRQKREKAVTALPDLTAKLATAQQELDEMESGAGLDMEVSADTLAAKRAEVRELAAALQRARQASGTARAGEPVRGEREPGAAPGEQNLESLVKEAKRRFPNDEQAALKWLQDQGIDTRSRKDARTQKDELFDTGQAGFQEEPSA